ncbi:hypothetical protein GCM10009789_37790 [Kribbella sancticallisti]|uniref:Uncharacterized protein n=1 Tax=Kribbella sancticallisti TaxID=460087 RepID=A0ABP4PJ69_9ACTN
MHTVGVILEILGTIVVILIACLFGLVGALAALLAAVPAVLVAWGVDAFWDTGFIDALAWAWTICTGICIAPAVGILKSVGILG